MAFTYGGITYHTNEADPTPLRNLISGVGLQGSGTSSFYAPVNYSQYLNPDGTINWDSLPASKMGPASNISLVGPQTKLYNSALQANDPLYGQITDTRNINNAQWSDYLGPAIGAALGAGFGALAPFGSQLLAQLPKLGQTLSNLTGGIGGSSQPTANANPLLSLLQPTTPTPSQSSSLDQLMNVLRNW